MMNSKERLLNILGARWAKMEADPTRRFVVMTRTSLCETHHVRGPCSTPCQRRGKLLRNSGRAVLTHASSECLSE